MAEHRVTCIPSFLPQRGWSKHTKGYLIYTSRHTCAALKRGAFLHRAVMQHLLGDDIPADMQVQHLWPFNKNCGSPHSLLLAPPEFNPSPSRRCPYTGQFLKPADFERRYGIDWHKVVFDVEAEPVAV